MKSQKLFFNKQEAYTITKNTLHPALRLKLSLLLGRVLHLADGQQQLVFVPSVAPDPLPTLEQDVQPGRHHRQRRDEGRQEGVNRCGTQTET
jgi:hypothetical protein